MKTKTKHIDDVQPATVDEHFEALLSGEELIDYEASDQMTPTELPDWYDEELFKAGQRYYASNLLGITTAGLAGLIAVLAIPSILKVLIYTRQSGTPCTAFRRYLETLLHVRVWYTTDPKENESNWYKTTNLVRFKHCISSRRSLNAGFGGITHRDMALTQFGFIGYLLLHPESLGLTNSPREREGINHFWRVVGHMIGISDRLNICRKTESETTELCMKLKDQTFAKYFREVPPNFVQMTEAMLEGMWSVDMIIDTDAVFAFTYKLTDVPYPRPLSLYSKMNFAYREMVHKLCVTPFIGTIVRNFFNYLLPITLWISERWPVIAWIQWGKEASKIRLYPKIQ